MVGLGRFRRAGSHKVAAVINGNHAKPINGHNRPMVTSHLHDTTARAMAELHERDPEAWARLRGAMAVLALPPVAGHERREIEIQIANDRWQRVDGVSVMLDGVAFWSRAGQGSQEFFFRASEGVPQWRTPAPTTRRRFTIDEER